MSRNKWVKITDCPYSAAILIKIFNNEKCKRSDLIMKGNGQTIKMALEFLESTGYLNIKDIRIPRISSEITLTEKGKRAARWYLAIENDEHIETINFNGKTTKECI